MVQFNIEVKVLNGKTPLLFAWWNQSRQTVDGCLVTCQCQELQLLEANCLGDSTGAEEQLLLNEALECSEVISILDEEIAPNVTGVVPSWKLGSNIEAEKIEEGSVRRGGKRQKRRDSVGNNNQTGTQGGKTGLDERIGNEACNTAGKVKKSCKRKKETGLAGRRDQAEAASQDGESGDGSVNRIYETNDIDKREGRGVGNDDENVVCIVEATAENERNVSVPCKKRWWSSDGLRPTPDLSVNPSQQLSDNGNISASTVCDVRDIKTEQTDSEYLDMASNKCVSAPAAVPVPLQPQISPPSMDKAIVCALEEVVCGVQSSSPISCSQQERLSLVENAPTIQSVEPTSTDFAGTSPPVIDTVRTGDVIQDKVSQITTKSPRNRKKKQSDRQLCELCGKSISIKSVTNHMRSFHSEGRREKSFQCGRCPASFYCPQNLSRHSKIHEGVRYKCRYCDKSYTQDWGRKVHENVHFPKESPVFPYKWGHYPRKHPQKFDETPVDCEVCGKTVKKRFLKAHLNTHSDRLYTCEYCGTEVKYYLRNTHLKLHTNSKDHQCSHCQMSFHFKSALTIHLRTHTKEKPIKCRYCEESFSRHGARIDHERKHTGERPYRCDLCEKSWRDRPTYTQHMRKHHPGRPMMFLNRGPRKTAPIEADTLEMATTFETAIESIRQAIASVE